MLEIVPMTLKEANAFVEQNHRHHGKTAKVLFGYIGMSWFEELDQFDGPEQVRNVEQSIFRGGEFAFCFKSFNPSAMSRNWANKYVIAQKAGRMAHHSTYLTTPPEWFGSKFLNDARHLQKTNETAYGHEYMGEVVGSLTRHEKKIHLHKPLKNLNSLL